MARSANPWQVLAGARRHDAPKSPGWLDSLRRVLARQRQLEEESIRLQIRRRQRS